MERWRDRFAASGRADQLDHLGEIQYAYPGLEEVMPAFG
jgi:hypothetical protein